jgi:cytochrome P450
LFSLPDDDARAPMAAMVRDYMSRFAGSVWDGLARTEADFAFSNRGRRSFQRQWSGHVDSIIAKRRGAEPNASSRDLLTLMLTARDPDTGEALTDADVRDQASTMLAAGFGTTARLLFWCAYLLCLDPSAQTRVRREIAAFPPDRVGGLDDLDHWPLLRLVMLEALRLYPPAPHLMRQAIAADTVLGETIGPGAQVWMSPWVIHRHHRFWDRPEAFMPERFAGQTSPWTSGPFMPFGAGPRICIGAAFAMAEAQIILATLLSRFAVTLADDRLVLPVGKLAIIPDHEPGFVLEKVP